MWAWSIGVESVFGTGEPVTLADPALVPAEIERFDRAVAASADELQAIVAKVGQQLGAAEAAIFRSHLTIVQDQSLRSKVRALVQTQQLTALSALQSVLQDYAATFARQEQEYFRERLADVRDVISRIGTHPDASGRLGADRRSATRRRIADYPGRPRNLAEPGHEPGQFADRGHRPPRPAAVRAMWRSCREAAEFQRFPDAWGSRPTCDRATRSSSTTRGVVLVRPDGETIAAYRKMQREFFNLKDRLVLNRDQPAVSADGVPVELLANINNLADAHAAMKVGATGVGLFRTEYLFLTHQDVPDEEEQYEHYRQIIEASPGPVTIRTLDLGGDKTVPYLGRRNEANPFMGWRSIRLSFEHPRSSNDKFARSCEPGATAA